MRFPHALAILNPNQPGCAYPEKSLCGAAIALKLAQALLERRDPAAHSRKDSAQLSEDGGHRHHRRCRAAARRESRHRRAGSARTAPARGRGPARALRGRRARSRQPKQLTGFDVAFRLAPRINAAGRMDVASEVIELFTTRDLGPRPGTGRQAGAAQSRTPRHGSLRADASIEARLAHRRRSWPPSGCWWSMATAGIAASSAFWPRAWSSAPPSRPSWSASKTASLTAPAAPSMAFSCSNAIESCADLFTRFGGHAFAVGFAHAGRPRCRNSSAACASMPRSAWLPASRSACCTSTPSCRWTALRQSGRMAAQAGAARPRQSRAHFCRPRRSPAGPASRIMKERHIRLELAQASGPTLPLHSASAEPFAPSAGIWPFAPPNLQLAEGSRIDLAYRIRENDHPEYGGLEIEIAGLEPAAS